MGEMIKCKDWEAGEEIFGKDLARKKNKNKKKSNGKECKVHVENEKGLPWGQ